MRNRSCLLHPSSQKSRRRNYSAASSRRDPRAASGSAGSWRREGDALRSGSRGRPAAPASARARRPPSRARREPGDPAHPAPPGPGLRAPGLPVAALLQWLRRRAGRPRDPGPGPASCAPPASSALLARVPTTRPAARFLTFSRAVESLGRSWRRCPS